MIDSFSFTKSPGKIVGLQFVFNSPGTITDVALKDGKGITILDKNI